MRRAFSHGAPALALAIATLNASCSSDDSGNGGTGATSGSGGADASAFGGSSGVAGSGGSTVNGGSSGIGGSGTGGTAAAGGTAGMAGQAGGGGQSGGAGQSGAAGAGAAAGKGGAAGAATGGTGGVVDAGWDASGSTNNCCAPASTPGCKDPAIEECVCKKDGACCASKWDAICVNDVEKYACGSCPDAGTGGGSGSGGTAGAAGSAGSSGSGGTSGTGGVGGAGGSGGSVDAGSCPGTIVNGLCVYLASPFSTDRTTAIATCQGLGSGWSLCNSGTLCSDATLSYLGAAGCDCNGGSSQCACGTSKNLYLHVNDDTRTYYARTTLVPNCDWSFDSCAYSTTIKCGAVLCCQ